MLKLIPRDQWREAKKMIDNLNDYLQYVYTGHKCAYALLVLLTTSVIGVGMEALTQLLAAKTRT